MGRYALKIEYDGQPFYGWQKQRDLPSVQACIETALRKLEPDCVGIQGAGRTDTGVHATGQVAHVDLARDWNARFSAIERRYLFRIVQRRAPMTFDRGAAWRVTPELDPVAMQAGADYLIGKHDFTTFRSSICQALSPVKTLDELRVETIALEHGIEHRFHIRARSFLHNQVRSFVGTLVRVGAGSWTPEQVKIALDSRDRAACGPVCPAHGLYLAAVTYPENPFA